MMFDRRLLTNFNWPLLAVSFFLLGLGLVNLYSATSSFDTQGQPARFQAQLVWSSIGVLIALVVTLVHYRHFKKMSFVFYGISLILLITVLVAGRTINGSQSWLVLGPFSIQPSEIAKMGLIFALSKHLAGLNLKGRAGFKDLISSLIIFGVPVLLVLLQGDLGSSLFFILIYTTLVLIQGVQWRLVAIMLVLGVVLSVGSYYYVLSPHQKARIVAFMHPELDRKGSGYHLIQSKIAVGSGGWIGKGYLKGETHKLKFIPERHTDFIFTVLAEEWGFLGGVFLLAVFTTFLILGLKVAEKANDRFGFFMSVGICALFFWHMVINLGGVLGLMPLTGVPLPFLSYGGSALLTDWLGIGLLLNISMRRFLFS